MSYHPRITCPICGRDTALHPTAGQFRPHGSVANRCPGSRRTPEEAGRYCISDITTEQWEVMRDCYRRGDVRPVELMFGITYDQPTHFVCDGTPEDELAAMVGLARQWINKLALVAQQRNRVL
ncbi:hypothetical protein [Mycolicibacterium mengxianglii]|uniref:hypothetical protein n=1 Tax=Mycolicibacterium mengxianglii TaxID=2736649 RepID=UPI0018D02D55|nr:hypothetical protein [Mycolicibacterium mengxianglii]